MTGLGNNGLPQSAEVWSENESDEKSGRTDVDESCGLGESNKDEDRAIGSMDGTQRPMISIGQAKRWKLLPGERLGWWSSRKFDRRVRMRALVMGAVNDERTKILLDAGANVSAVTEAFARKLRLKRLTNNDMKIDVQGIAKSKVATTSRAIIKVTLGWEMVYELEVWIMPHHAGVDLILGTDFMIPSGIRLDLYSSMAKLPDEVVVPLIKSSRDVDDTEYGREVIGGPRETLDIIGREIAQFKLRRRHPSESTHDLWVRQLQGVIPTVKHNAAGRAVRVLLTNITASLTWCPAHFPVALWMPHGVLPRDGGYVRVNSAKYRDWQVLAYEGALDNRLLRKKTTTIYGMA